MRLITTDRTKIIYSMYRAGEVSVHRACCERATQSHSLGSGGTIYPGSRPADVNTRSSRMVAECLLTRSMLIKMYYHFMVCACICTIVFTVSRFHADVYLVYLVFQVRRIENRDFYWNLKICIFQKKKKKKKCPTFWKSCLNLAKTQISVLDQILRIIRRRAEYKNHNSCLYSFEVIPL